MRWIFISRWETNRPRQLYATLTGLLEEAADNIKTRIAQIVLLQRKVWAANLKNLFDFITEKSYRLFWLQWLSLVLNYEPRYSVFVENPREGLNKRIVHIMVYYNKKLVCVRSVDGWRSWLGATVMWPQYKRETLWRNGSVGLRKRFFDHAAADEFGKVMVSNNRWRAERSHVFRLRSLSEYEDEGTNTK